MLPNHYLAFLVFVEFLFGSSPLAVLVQNRDVGAGPGSPDGLLSGEGEEENQEIKERMK